MSDECESTEMTGKASAEIVAICQQAEETHRLAGWRHDTHFYKTVLGGNLGVVKQLVEYMENNGMSDTLDWLWMRGQYEERKDKCQKPMLKTLKKIIMFITLGILNIIVTPIFYAVHLISVSYVSHQQSLISERIQLPLAFAAFCQCPSMLQYFLSQGVDIEDMDEKGNNVFHYVADLSADTAECAINVFQTLVEFINNPDTVRSMVLEQRNSGGLTPLEYSAKLGSPLLLSATMKTPKLLQDENALGNFHKGQSKENGILGKSCKTIREEQNECTARENSEEKFDGAEPARLELVDVSMYEAGSLANKSRLLNLLSGRDVAVMSREELSMFKRHEVIGKWTKLKTRQMMGGVLLFQVCDIAITCVLLFLLSLSAIGTTGSGFIKWKIEQDGHVQFVELSAWKDNRSSIFTQEAFHRIMKGKSFDMEYEGLLQMHSDSPELVEELFATTSADNHPSLADFYDSEIHAWNISFDLLQPNETNALYDTALTMDAFKDNVTYLYVARYLPTVLQHIAEKIWHRQNEIVSEIFYLGDPDATNFYNNITVSYNGQQLYPSRALWLNDFWSILCLPGNEFQLHDLKWIDQHVYTVTNDSCYYQLVLNCAMKSGKCDQTGPIHLANYIVDDTPDDQVLNACRIFVLVCTVAYISLDVFERWVFIWTCTQHQSTYRSMLKTTLGQKVPGSYARKQLNMFSYMFILIARIQEKYSESTDISRTPIAEYFHNSHIAAILLILAIIIRFVMHIHSLRLLPGIGNFVITTFRMGTNLLHFSTVFGCVVLIFAVLFFILIDDPNCPIQNSAGFKTLSASMFSTFKLTFGHGDLDPFFIDTSVQMAYVLYVVIMCLLLLNLIIAIMSTTATDIMAEPWKSSLWKVEWLDEATSVEYAFAMIGLPFKKLSLFGYYTHRKAGFVTKQMPDKKYRVYIEMFHCPKLNKAN